MPEINELNDEQIGELERDIANEKREREHAKWDAELVGRYFRVIRVRDKARWPFFDPFQPLTGDDYITLEESLAVGTEAHAYVYADVAYLHIKSRNDSELTCSGFQLSHANRKEPYLKIQPVFYSWGDFRNHLNSWGMNSGPTKHFDEITKRDYEDALRKAVTNFTGLYE